LSSTGFEEADGKFLFIGADDLLKVEGAGFAEIAHHDLQIISPSSSQLENSSSIWARKASLGRRMVAKMYSMISFSVCVPGPGRRYNYCNPLLRQAPGRGGGSAPCCPGAEVVDRGGRSPGGVFEDLPELLVAGEFGIDVEVACCWGDVWNARKRGIGFGIAGDSVMQYIR